MAELYPFILTEDEKAFMRECEKNASASTPLKTEELRLRSTALLHLAETQNRSEVARRFNIPIKTLYYWINKYREVGKDFIIRYRTITRKRVYDNSRILKGVERAISVFGNNRMSVATLSIYSRISIGTLKKRRDEWRHLIKSPGRLKKPVVQPTEQASKCLNIQF